MLNNNRIKISGVDYAVVATMLVLILIGLMAIYSASFRVENAALKENFSRQIGWFFIGLVLMALIILAPTRILYSSAYWLYGASLLLLIVTLMMKKGGNVSRWLVIGSFQFQPSEIMKLGTLFMLARYLSHDKRNLHKLKDIAMAFLIVLLPFILIARQPDLGTALVFMAIILPILYWAGLPAFYLFVFLVPFIVMIASFHYYAFIGVIVLISTLLLFSRRGLFVSVTNIALNIGVGLMTPVLWSQLKDYQKHRILTFLGLEIDPHGLSYQVIQSKVAIGSGGFFGKGFLNGTQTQLRFLPAQHTDFVFSVIGEEMGFAGSFLALGLFLFLLLRGIYIASVVKNKFAGLLVIGATTILGFHVIVNIGMTVGMMPVTGLPLPFVSYGGSFLITSMMLMGIIIHASIRRFWY